MNGYPRQANPLGLVRFDSSNTHYLHLRRGVSLVSSRRVFGFPLGKSETEPPAPKGAPQEGGAKCPGAPTYRSGGGRQRPLTLKGHSRGTAACSLTYWGTGLDDGRTVSIRQTDSLSGHAWRGKRWVAPTT